jgi:site-specific DNA recombinase
MDDPELREIYNKKMKEQRDFLINIEDRIEHVKKQLLNVSKDPIDADSLKHLLKNLDTTLEKADAAEKKELLALFVKDIQITKDRVFFKEGRQITQINLMFDFTIEALQGSTSTLLNSISEINCIAPVDLSFMNNPSYNENSMREALTSLNLLPLLMVRFTTINPKRTVNLFN